MDERTLIAAGLTVVVATVYAGLLGAIQRLATRGRATLAQGAAGNPARRFYAAGQVFGLLYTAGAVVDRCVEGDSWKVDVGWASTFALLAFVLFVGAGQVGVRLLLGHRLPAEIDEGNVGAGIAAGAHHVAMALLIAQAAGGTDQAGLPLALSFFGLGVLAHQLLLAGFRALTTYDDAEQIAGGNAAAAVSYAGVSLAVAVIVARALEGDFEGWSTSLVGFAQTAALALVLWPVRQLLVQGLLLRARPRLRGGELDRAVGGGHDVALAALEALCLLATALAVVRLR